ncbi:MAG: hypothetical protein V1644_03735 [Candidatus Micrarchaeota archaeon]
MPFGLFDWLSRKPKVDSFHMLYANGKLAGQLRKMHAAILTHLLSGEQHLDSDEFARTLPRDWEVRSGNAVRLACHELRIAGVLKIRVIGKGSSERQLHSITKNYRPHVERYLADR